MRVSRFWMPVLCVLWLAASPFGPSVADAQARDAEREAAERKGPFRELKYRLIGPAASGRVSRVAGVPGDPRIYWAATAAGGVWKSVNGGIEWKSVFDDQPVSSIGSIAVSPSDPNVVWVGSGEANIRGNVGEGNGIYRSVDAGKTWKHVWQAEGQIGTIVVHPTQPDVAYAAALGSPFGPGPDRGVMRTTDGGKTWKRVLFVDEDTGASDVCFDPANPRILFAGTWPTRRTPWGFTSGGPGGGLWTSRDGGDTWKRLVDKRAGVETGLPKGIWGRVGVAVARTDSSRVYALIEAKEGGLFRSDDGGEKWTRINDSQGLRQRAWYYSTMTVDPGRADVVWFPQVNMLKTVDGGRGVRSVKGGGWDYHDVWIDPTDARRMIVASDAGVSLSLDEGKTWRRPPLPISQFYHVSVDSREPYRILGTLQDWGTVSGPSRTFHGAGVLLSDWRPVGGGEAGHIAADPTNPDVIWAGEYLGYLSRFDGRTQRSAHVGIDPDNGSGRGAGDLRYRFQWTAPIVISPHDPRTVYHAANVLLRTRDAGQTWQPISPDLTRNDPSKLKWSGGPITGDNTGVEFYGTIFAVAESPAAAGVIWAGSDDGRVHVTRDAGQAWNEVTPRDLPEWGTVAKIEPSRTDAGTAWLVVDAHRLDDETPYLWRTEDFGASWKRLGGDLDPEVYLHVIRQDLRRPDVLYLGTERGVQVSHDGGDSWRSLRLNMPTVAVVDLALADDDLVVATLGRSAFILDDLTPVREMTQAITQAPAHLFVPRTTRRWHRVGEWSAPLGSHEGAGKNPPSGVILNYHLAARPEKPIRIELLDSAGKIVRTLRSEVEPQYTTDDHPDWDADTELEPALTTKRGLNRAAWDLAYERSRWVPGSRLDTGGPGSGPQALPGEYKVRLVVEDKSYVQPLTVTPDPRAPVDPAALRRQFEFCLELRDRMSRVAKLVQGIRDLRTQLKDRAQRLANNPAAAELLAAGRALVAKLDTIEGQLHNAKATVNYDVLAGRGGGAKLVSRLGWLLYGALDHAGPPTQGQTEVAAILARLLDEQKTALAAVKDEGLTAFNRTAAELGLPFVISP